MPYLPDFRKESMEVQKAVYVDECLAAKNNT